MNARVKVQTPAAIFPVSVDELKTHMRVFTSADDDYIAALRAAAIKRGEDVQDRAYCLQTLELTLDAWPCYHTIQLPKATPLVSVTCVKYTDIDGVERTLSADAYLLDQVTEPGRIVLRWDESWPSDELREINGITVRYVVGSAAADVAPTIKHAIRYLVAHWYENREPVTDVANNPVPMTWESLIDHDRITWCV